VETIKECAGLLYTVGWLVAVMFALDWLGF
jgi:hypothetical protein